MGILVSCPNGHRLNLKAELAGLRGVCPRCGTAFDIPKLAGGATGGTAWPEESRRVAVEQESRSMPAPPPVAHAAGGDPLAERPDATWYVRPAAGGQYGPADGEMLRQWLEAGRVAADSELQRDDWPAGQLAAEVFPQRFAGEEATAGAESEAPSIQAPKLSPAELRAARRKARRRRTLVMLVLATVCLVPVLVYVLANQ